MSTEAKLLNVGLCEELTPRAPKPEEIQTRLLMIVQNDPNKLRNRKFSSQLDSAGIVFERIDFRDPATLNGLNTGQLLRLIRISEGLQLEDLAGRIDIKKGRLVHIELGKSPLIQMDFTRIYNGFALSPDDIRLQILNRTYNDYLNARTFGKYYRPVRKVRE